MNRPTEAEILAKSARNKAAWSPVASAVNAAAQKAEAGDVVRVSTKPDGKRTLVVRTSISESTKKLAEEKRQARGLHDMGAYLHDLVLRDTHGITVTKVDLSSKGNNPLNSKGGDK